MSHPAAILLAIATLLAKCAFLAFADEFDGWSQGRATFYGEDGGTTIDQGSCMFGYIDPNKGTGRDIAAISDKAYDYSGSCGRCYEVACRPAYVNDGYGNSLDRQSSCQGQKSVTVMITDTCPCYYPSNAYSNTRWCCGDTYHMDLSQQAFAKIANTGDGAIAIYYRVVDCPGTGSSDSSSSSSQSYSQSDGSSSSSSSSSQSSSSDGSSSNSDSSSWSDSGSSSSNSDSSSWSDSGSSSSSDNSSQSSSSDGSSSWSSSSSSSNGSSSSSSSSSSGDGGSWSYSSSSSNSDGSTSSSSSSSSSGDNWHTEMVDKIKQYADSNWPNRYGHMHDRKLQAIQAA